MRCEDVRPLLSQVAEGSLRIAGPVEAHLAECAACTADLEQYRDLMAGLGGLTDVLVEPSAGFLDRVLAEIPGPQGRLRRVAVNRRVVFSVGGAVVGATAVGLLWRRNARRTLVGAAQPAEAVSPS
jgi:hypothetical protein